MFPFLSSMLEACGMSEWQHNDSNKGGDIEMFTLTHVIQLAWSYMNEILMFGI